MTSFSNFKTTLVKKATSKAGAPLGGGMEVASDVASLPMDNSTSQGDLYFTEGSSKLWMRGNNAWYNITLVNTNPSFTVNGDILIVPTGGPLVITPEGGDPEELPVEWSYQLEGDSTAFSVSITDGVYTITESGTTPTTGTATLTLTASDGINTGSQQVTLFLNSYAVGMSESSPARSAQHIFDVMGQMPNDYYWIQPDGADAAVKVYCWFTSTAGWMLVISSNHNSGNSMINDSPASSVGMVANSNGVDIVDGETYSVFSSNSYLKVNRDWMDRFETASGGNIQMIIMAFSDTDTPSAIEEYTHIRDTGDVLTDFPGAFVRSSSNGMYNMGGSWYMSDYSGAAYGSYHQGVINDWTTPGYHGNDRGSHFGHYHRSGVNSGVYCFGDNVYIQEAEWNARFLYFVK